MNVDLKSVKSGWCLGIAACGYLGPRRSCKSGLETNLQKSRYRSSSYEEPGLGQSRLEFKWRCWRCGAANWGWHCRRHWRSWHCELGLALLALRVRAGAAGAVGALAAVALRVDSGAALGMALRHGEWCCGAASGAVALCTALWRCDAASAAAALRVTTSAARLAAPRRRSITMISNDRQQYLQSGHDKAHDL